jgi:hypothetical protein
MARTKLDPEILAHLEWIGFVRPTGLVVSAPALVRAGAILDRRDVEGQRLLRSCAEERTFDPKEGLVSNLPDFRAFAESVLQWSFSPKGYAGTAECPIPPELEVSLPDYGETLRPDFAVREFDPKEGACPWQLLVQVVEPDHAQPDAAEQSRMERLLRQTGVPAGLLFNGRVMRLVSAPRGESSGWLDFRVADMVLTAGRPISTAMRLLLGEQRLLSLPREKRLAALLEDSRKFQNEVSERLAEQVLHALYEFLRGFQAAHDASKGELLRQPLVDHPDEIYRSLLTVILRLVFLLFAEERDMLPEDETFLRYYSLAGLYERLREDAALFPDTMDQRYGAWAQLLVLFRMVHDGAESGHMRLPRRLGVLFDPDRFKFLEGRQSVGARQTHDRIEAPLVPDGTIFRALDKLLVLDGERISYRALDVEQIGSVYETMMGFRLETATGRSLGIKAQKKHGAPTAVDLEALLGEPAPNREKWLQDRADRKITDTVKKAIAGAATLEDLHAALLPLVDLAATPDLVPTGAMVLQPSEERRRSGSHYTPRALTEPIVRTTLEPILARLRGADGRPPRPAQILDLKVCDPAMGSGAFLVEACRQLGDSLVEAWHTHGDVPPIPPDEDEVVFARRLIAQRCIYGVDRNPVAVDLSKVSLWLVTLAKDHALTFVDHALRHGDSLVGLSRKQIEAFHWDPDATRFQAGFESMRVRDQVAEVAKVRKRIREADQSVSDWELRDLWDEAQFELGNVRLYGDLVLAAFLESERPKEREAKRSEYARAVVDGKADRYGRWLEERRYADQPLAPFHWELEFPEVFDRDNAGFDAMVGNPPFMGGKGISGTLSPQYLDWLHEAYPGSSGQVDLVTFFVRRAFMLSRTMGILGLLTTKTIAQGDSRRAGLMYVCMNGGVLFNATKRIPWPGTAAVTVSAIHIANRCEVTPARLNGVSVVAISPYLVPGSLLDEPSRLAENRDTAFMGYYNYGDGFIFCDGRENCESIARMTQIIAQNPRSRERVFPFIGGEEVLESPSLQIRRYVIDFAAMPEEEARKWPELFEVLERRVKSERAQCKRERLRKLWWQFGEVRPGLREATVGRVRLLMHPFTSKYLAFSFVPADVYIASPHYAIVLESFASFAALQSQVHEVWARFFASSLEDRLRYTASDCFETFPFPQNWETQSGLETAGTRYYEFRAALMLRNDEGLTKTYNRFHNPDERGPGILTLRDHHAAMDRAVLDAYGWRDIPTECEFLLDYEIDEDEWGDKQKPWRYRWPDHVQDEVLARLLKLNAERAREDVLAGAGAMIKGSKKRAGKSASEQPEMDGLFS